MKPSLLAKLDALSERHEEVAALLGDPDTIADQDRFRTLSREYAPRVHADSRLRPLRRRRRNTARPARVDIRARKPSFRLREILDG